MKTIHILIAMTMVAALTMVACKNNNKKAQSQEPTQEEIQAQKVALADSVLSEIDALTDEFILVSGNSFSFRYLELTENEKLAKPDYLLDPSFANSLVTKNQKVTALAYYCIDLGVRIMYNMPTQDTEESIAKLAMDVNFPVDMDQYETNVPKSERIKAEYLKCKERGDFAYFWQFQNAILTETGYVIAQNPELFFSKITEGQWQTFANRTNGCLKAMRELANYDEEMTTVLEMFNQNRVFSSDEEKASADTSYESAKQNLISNKDKIIAKRNAFLQ